MATETTAADGGTDYDVMTGPQLAIEIAKRQGWVCEPHSRYPEDRVVRAPWEGRGRSILGDTDDKAWMAACLRGHPRFPRPDAKINDCAMLLKDMDSRGWTYDIYSTLDRRSGVRRLAVRISMADPSDDEGMVTIGYCTVDGADHDIAFRRAVCVAYLRACDADKKGGTE